MMFISFEGMNGSGKSTQARLFVDWLKSQGKEVVLTREPGGTLAAEEIRTLVLSGGASKFSRKTEVMLFKAARNAHIEELIRPSLAQGKIVVSDRFIDSTRVLQTHDDVSGKIRGLIDSLHSDVIGLDPNLTVFIDVSLETAGQRVSFRQGGEQDRMELVSGMQQHEYDSYQKLAVEFPDRIVRVSGEGTQEEVAERVRELIKSRLTIT